MREALLGVAVGKKGIGKTYTTLSVINQYIKGGLNIKPRRALILDVNDEFGTTVVLIEHDMSVVMDISDRVVVLDYGKKIGDGTPDEVRNNLDVISAYLGTSH